MTKEVLKIATRNSPLALWQAEHIKQRLEEHHPELHIELLGISTAGDKWLQTSLSKIGGKALFVKELETALLNGDADIAVHSMKDVPVEFPAGLELGVITHRADPSDAFVSNHYQDIKSMPSGAVVGTSSLRRESQLRHFFPQLTIKPVRGNVNTRLSKLDAGEFDALILASAGLKRLGFEARITHPLAFDVCLPAVGQGALGIELRVNDDKTASLIRCLQDDLSSRCVQAERALNAKLNGGCAVPVAGYAVIDDSKNPPQFFLRALVGEIDGARLVSAQERGLDPVQLGESVAEQLLRQGAGEILDKLRSQHG